MKGSRVVNRTEERAIRMLNGIFRTVTAARRLDARVNNLKLWDVGEQKMSEVEWQDHPDVQMLLRRRNRLFGIVLDIERIQKVLDSGELEPRHRANLASDLAHLRAAEAKELDAISDKLDTLRSESTRHWSVVAKMLTDAAKLKQNDSQFRAKLEKDDAKDAGLSLEERAVIEAAKPKDEEDE